MKAYIYAFEGKPWNEECKTALEGFKRYGIECVLFSSNEELDKREPGDIVVGGMLIMEHALTELGITVDSFDYPDELRYLLGRRIWVCNLKNVTEFKPPFFIKPAVEKAAKGIVVNSYDDLKEYEHLDKNMVMYCSEVLKFESEWRCFICKGKILGVQHYNGDWNKKCDSKVIEKALKAYSDAPAAYALDFGVTDDGKTVLIEMNDGFAIGSYYLPDWEYARFLATRWGELTGTLEAWEKALDVRVRIGQYAILRNGMTVYITEIVEPKATYRGYDAHLRGRHLVTVKESEIEHIADEICKAVIVE